MIFLTGRVTGYPGRVGLTRNKIGSGHGSTRFCFGSKKIGFGSGIFRVGSKNSDPYCHVQFFSPNLSLFFSLSLHRHQPSNDIASSSPAIKPTPLSWPLPIPSTLSLVPKSPPTTRPEPATPPSSLKFFWLGGPLSLAPIHLFYFIPNWNLDFPKELSLLCSFSSIAE